MSLHDSTETNHRKKKSHMLNVVRHCQIKASPIHVVRHDPNSFKKEETALCHEPVPHHKSSAGKTLNISRHSPFADTSTASFRDKYIRPFPHPKH